MSSLEDLSTLYDASLEATGQRIVTLASSPTLLLILEPATKPSEATDPNATPKLRVRAVRHNGPWPFIPRFKSIPDDTVLYRAFEGEVVDQRTTITGLTRDPLTGIHVHAKLFPYGSTRTKRVIALVQRNHSRQR